MSESKTLIDKCNLHIGHTVTYKNNLDLSSVSRGVVLRNVRTAYGIKIYLDKKGKSTLPVAICIEQILKCSCE